MGRVEVEAGPAAYGVVEGLYEAALQPEALPDALRALAKHVDAHTALLILTEPGRGAAGFLSRGSDPRLVSRESLEQAPDNPWTRAARRQQPGTLLLTDEMVSTNELRTSPFYESVVKPLRIEHGMGCVFRAEGGCEAFLVAHRSAQEGPFRPEAVERFRALVPSLGRACRVNVCLAEARGSRRAALSALHGLRMGVVLVEPDRRVRFANQSAVRAFEACAALTVKDGRLVAGNRAETEDLQHLITAAIEKRRAPRATVVHCPEHGQVIEIVVLPDRAPSQMDASAVVLFRTPHEPPGGLETLLEQLYQLTPTEARVACAVLDGQGLRQSAQQLGIGVSTARTHLCRVFEKTGTRRQAELVRFLLDGPALLVGRD